MREEWKDRDGKKEERKDSDEDNGEDSPWATLPFGQQEHTFPRELVR